MEPPVHPSATATHHQHQRQPYSKKKLQHLQAAASIKSLNFETQNYHLLHQVVMPVFSVQCLLKNLKIKWKETFQ
jgi:hypothetical protein